MKMCVIGDITNIERVQKGDVKEDYFVVRMREGCQDCVNRLRKNYDDVDAVVVRNGKWRCSLGLSLDEFIKYMNRHIKKNSEVLIPIRACTRGEIPRIGDTLVVDAYGREQEIERER